MYRVSSRGSCWYPEWQESHCEQVFLADDSGSQSEYDLGAVCSMGRGLFKLTTHLGSSGVTAGIDMMLHWVEQTYSAENATNIARFIEHVRITFDF